MLKMNNDLRLCTFYYEAALINNFVKELCAAITGELSSGSKYFPYYSDLLELWQHYILLLSGQSNEVFL